MKDCCEMGMELIAVSRQEYSNRYQAGFAEKYLRQFQKSIQQPIQQPMIWVPEGGTETKAVEACEQIGFEINQLADNYAFDALWIAVGSGGTLAGIARSLNPSIQIRAVPVMKNYLTVKQRLSGYLNQQQSARITWVENGWYQGFGRFKQADVKRLLELEKQTGVPLDPVYTAKVMRRMIEAIQKNEFSDSRPLFLHTGGLQGRRSISNDE
jgi:1-aminocyclopropane-1-carboxylate deaminase